MLQKRLGHLAALYLLLLLVPRYKLSYHKTICYLLFQCLQRIPCRKPLIISFCSSLDSTLLLIVRTMIDPLYLWVITGSYQAGDKAGLTFATKRIGPPCCTLFTFVTCCSLQIILLQNYLLPIISVLAENTLPKTAYHFLLLLVGFDTLTYRKDYDRSPILVGHQDSFLAPLPGSVAPLVSGIW